MTYTDKIKELLDDSDVALFMKGTPDAPACGFSARTVGALHGSESVDRGKAVH